MIKYELKGFEKLLKELDPDLVRRANAMAINKALAKTQTYVSRRVRSNFNGSAAALARRARIWKASDRVQSGMLWYKGARPGLINFDAKPKVVTIARTRGKGRHWGNKRTGVTVKFWRALPRKLVTEPTPGFIAVGKQGNRHIYYRTGKFETDEVTGKKREKIASNLVRSVPEMINWVEKVAAQEDKVEAFAYREQVVEFDRALGYLVETRS